MKNWVPKMGEKYYYIYFGYCEPSLKSEIEVTLEVRPESELMTDTQFEFGIFRTKKEAIKAKNKIIKILKG